MKKKIIIVNIQLNTHKYTEKRLTKEWIDNRIDIFHKFTLQSFKKQTNQDFLTFVNYDPVTEELVKESLSRYEALPKNILFVTPLQFREKLAQCIKDYKYLYLVRLDSDNMYHKTYMQQLRDYRPKKTTEVLISQNGYVYDSNQDILVEYYQPSPPFYAYIYKVKDYLNGKRYTGIKGHGAIIKVLAHEIMQKRNYVVLLHSSNYHNTTQLLKHKKVITDKNEARKIMEEFIG